MSGIARTHGDRHSSNCLISQSNAEVRETASAIILDAHPMKNKGFSHILFDYRTESINAYKTYCSTVEIKPRLNIQKDPDLQDIYIISIVPVVQGSLSIMLLLQLL